MEIDGGDKMVDKMIKILCHTCRGQQYIEEERWILHTRVKVVCPECHGDGYIEVKEWQDK
jgi:DnaJ-class molecular chaperone